MEHVELFNCGFWGDALRGLRERTLERRRAQLEAMTPEQRKEAESDAPLPTVGPGASELTPYELHWIAERMNDAVIRHGNLERHHDEKATQSAADVEEQLAQIRALRKAIDDGKKQDADDNAIAKAVLATDLHDYAQRALDTHSAQVEDHQKGRDDARARRERAEEHMQSTPTFEAICGDVYAHIAADVPATINASTDAPEALPANVDE